MLAAANAMEEVVVMSGGGDDEDVVNVINEQAGGLLPPGFRFHPTDEELITFYLASKVYNGTTFSCDGTVHIAEIDLNRCEPWELPEAAKMGEREWYLFSLRDRKYPTGLRTNRATGAGYWKATGKDREVYMTSTTAASTTSTSTSGALIGMKKTLVFYKGRAPRGEKTKWVMHEFRLDGHFSCTRHPSKSKEEWVICRIVDKLVEKKNPNFQGQQQQQQHYLLRVEANPSSPRATTALSTLLFETTSRSRSRRRSLVLEEEEEEEEEESLQYSNNPLIMQAIQNPFLINHESDHHLIKKVLSQPRPNLFPAINYDIKPSFSPPIPIPIPIPIPSPSICSCSTTTNNKDTNPQNNPISPSPPISNAALFNSLGLGLSRQGFTFKEHHEPTHVPKHYCKTEPNFSHFQPSDANMHWVDKIHENPLFFGMDCSVMGYSSASASASADTVPFQDMSTSMAFRQGRSYMSTSGYHGTH